MNASALGGGIGGGIGGAIVLVAIGVAVWKITQAKKSRRPGLQELQAHDHRWYAEKGDDRMLESDSRHVHELD